VRDGKKALAPCRGFRRATGATISGWPDQLTKLACNQAGFGRDGAASDWTGFGNKTRLSPILNSSEREARTFPIEPQPRSIQGTEADHEGGIRSR
jgi:hypothetical protein